MSISHKGRKNGPGFIDRQSWEFWVRQQQWPHKTAAIVLSGAIPDAEGGLIECALGFKDRYPFEYLPQVNWLELVTNRFPPGPIAVTEFFGWVASQNIWLPPDVVEAADQVPSLKEAIRKIRSANSTVSATDGRGGSFADKRYLIVCAALKHLSALDAEEFQKLKKPNGALNVAALARRLDDERHRYPALKESGLGTSLKNITETLNDALRERPKKVPKKLRPE